MTRPVSRVERWLKSRTIVYASAPTVGPEQAGSVGVRLNPTIAYQDNPTSETVPASHEIPRAAVLAAAMDRSEHFVARITQPVHQRSHFSDRCQRSASCGLAGSSGKTNVAAKTRKTGKLVQVAGQFKGRTAKRLASTSSKIAALKLMPVNARGLAQPVAGKMALGLKPPLFAVVKPGRAPALVSPRDVLLADSPAEIIRRSLRGTT